MADVGTTEVATERAVAVAVVRGGAVVGGGGGGGPGGPLLKFVTFCLCSRVYGLGFRV